MSTGSIDFDQQIAEYESRLTELGPREALSDRMEYDCLCAHLAVFRMARDNRAKAVERERRAEMEAAKPRLGELDVERTLQIFRRR